MLRHQHLPSDFNPKYLILGDNADFEQLARLLRSFVETPRLIDIGASVKGSKGPSLVLAPAGERHGLFATDGGYVWSLNPYQASIIVNRLDILADAMTLDASDLFELGGSGEIPVAVSLGEFPDAYLNSRGA